MKISADNFDKVSMTDWANDFWHIYEKHDKRRSLADIWLMVNEEAAKTCKGIRTGNYELLIKSLCHTFCWVASFVNKILKDQKVDDRFSDTRRGKFPNIESMVFYKYPRYCLSCMKRECICPVLSSKIIKDEEKINKWRKAVDSQSLAKWPLDEWQNMFDAIYTTSHMNHTFGRIGFHFSEEVGEVSTEIRNLQECSQTEIEKCRVALYEEIADTISWCFSIVKRISQHVERSENVSKVFGNQVQFTKITLSQLLWNEYKADDGSHIVCHKCKNKVHPDDTMGHPRCQCRVKIIYI